MRLTFRNKLKIVPHYDGMPRIEYLHDRACDIRIFIEKRKPVTNLERPAHNVDWKITIEGASETNLTSCRKDISIDLAAYIKQRTRKDITKMTFKDLQTLAEMGSIKES